MTRGEISILADLMKSYADGKLVEWKERGTDDNKYLPVCMLSAWSFADYEYRIVFDREAPKDYRPYYNFEMQQACKQHHCIHVKYNNSQCELLILHSDNDGIMTTRGKILYSDLCTYFVWSDGTPCGMKKD